MDFLLDNWLLVLVALTSGALLLRPLLTQGAGSVTSNEAVRLINREKAVLIDVSEPAEYAAGHAVGAKSVPMAGLETSASLPKNKALPLIVMCPNGARAVRAASMLKKLGFDNTHALTGGLVAWRAANLPVEKSV
ncbi:MAG: rhodanese-like domain-containing protein [Burkholderiaceae bacterium]|nr:rhodanese-like domain-containing protein [Burkholderiaceae bacterium]MDH3460440.1 rhodanese-like domain-containing protein [Burkholderiaceae bacterium]